MNSTVKTDQGHRAEEGIWIFIFADMCMFGIFFITFMYERLKSPALYIESQLQLNQALGMINTLVLLISSWFVVLATRALHRGRPKYSSLFLGLAFFCGAVFVVNKVIEYSEKIEQGISILTNDFFMFYYVLTGIHLAHVLGGMVVLFVLMRKLKNSSFQKTGISTVEGGAIYWHMVDLLWILIFPLIYFLR